MSDLTAYASAMDEALEPFMASAKRIGGDVETTTKAQARPDKRKRKARRKRAQASRRRNR